MTERLLTGVERHFEPEEVIVSKTDLAGRIIYANRVFQKVAGFTEAELLGQPHSLIRHPAMPRCVFKALWDTISQGQEIFAYVINRAKNGDHYWVLAHVSATYDETGRNIISYHSSRRKPRRDAIAKAEGLYARLVAEEGRHANRKTGMLAGEQMLVGVLNDAGISYDEFVFGL